MDRLTSGMLRDFGALWDDYTSGSVKSLGAYLSDIAARREAEAKLQKRCDRLDPPVCLHPDACANGCTFNNPGHAASEGPGSAADDLVKRLREAKFFNAFDGQAVAREAADKIEAQAGEIAELLAGQHMLTVMDAERDALKARVSALQDLAIWMTGCGYDFTQHPYYMQNRHLLTGAEATDAQG